MEELLNRRAALAKTKTPWIFALITTGILVFMWSSIFIVWVVKRIRQGNGRLEYKHEKQSATQAEDYIIPPDPALIGKGDLVFDAEKARELFMKDNTSRAHSIQKETEGVNTAEPSALLSPPHASTNVN